MARTTILAAGTTAETSTDIVVPQFGEVTVAIFSATAERLPVGVSFLVHMKTPGADQFFAALNDETRVLVLSAAGTFTLKRPAYTGIAFGAFTET